MNLPYLAAVKSRDAYQEATVSVGDTQILITEDDDSVWIAFRGTEGSVVGDWATDINFKLIHTLIGQVHQGFWEAFELVQPYVESKATSALRDGKKLYLTGHSLGGALATVAFAWLEQGGLTPEHCYTFGSPRVFGKDTAHALNRWWKPYMTRCVNNNDVVTRVPTRSMGYGHVGELEYHLEGGELVDEDALTAWRLFWDRVDGRLEDFGEIGLDGLKDHSIDEYVELKG